MFVGAVSSRVSENQAAGHYYWWYAKLDSTQRSSGLPVPATIGPLDSTVNFVQPLISPKATKFEFSLSARALAQYRLRRLLPLLRERKSAGVNHNFFYDGGLTEFWVCFFAAGRIPGVNFIFNFHWADRWMAVLRSPKLSARLLRSSLRWCAHRRPKNLTLSAETDALAGELTERLGVTFRTFPIFSTLKPARVKKWENRELDLLILPQRPSELDFVSLLIDELSALNIRSATYLKLDTFDRWPASPVKKESLNPRFLPLSEKEYSDLLNSARLTLLPYDKPYFEWGSSGKFNEAIALGSFPLVPEGTAISSQSSGDPVFHEIDMTNVEEVAKKIVTLSNLPHLPKLKPVFIEDFLAWAKAPSLSPAGPKIGWIICLLLLFFSGIFYRQDARLASLRFALGSALDRRRAARYRN